MPAHATTTLWETNTAECTRKEATSYKLKVEVNVGSEFKKVRGWHDRMVCNRCK